MYKLLTGHLIPKSINTFKEFFSPRTQFFGNFFGINFPYYASCRLQFKILLILVYQYGSGMEVMDFTNKNQVITTFSETRTYPYLLQIWVLAPLNPVYDRVLMFLSGMEVVWKYHFLFCYLLIYLTSILCRIFFFNLIGEILGRKIFLI